MGHNLEIEPLATHIFFDALKLPGGYFYLVKLSDGLGVACIVLEKSRTNNPPRHYFERFIKGNNFLKESFRNFKPIKNFEGFGLIDSVKKRGIGNVMLAGDAGRVMDPLFGYGMGNSIISGYSAADIASFSIKEGDPQFVEQYDKTLLSNIPNLENNYEIRGRYNKLRNDDFNRIFLGLLEGREPNRVEFSEDVRPLLDAFSSIMH
jgi:digeranylgeranylglycerophospholipid reductase